MNKQRVINASIDCINNFKISKYPIKNIAQEIIRSRKLNSQERAVFLDLVFLWARESYLVNKFLEKNIKFYNGLSNQQKDILAINILVDQDNNYKNYLKILGDDRYLIALGEVFREELIKSHGAKAQEIAKGIWEKPTKYLAFDSLVYTRENIIKELADNNIIAHPHALAPHALRVENNIKLDNLPKKLQENLWFMDAGSQIIASCVKSKIGERVLDLCVGEGNKARLIAMSQCSLVALDINSRRLEHAKKRLKDFSVEYICADGANSGLEPESFDWILIDAPCSGSGVLRRNPDLIYRLSKEQLINYQTLQHNLLVSAIKLLKPGGKIIYATCSLFSSENQQQIDNILKANTNLLSCELDYLNKSSFELIPHIYDCDGFYIAGLMKMRD